MILPPEKFTVSTSFPPEPLNVIPPVIDASGTSTVNASTCVAPPAATIAFSGSLKRTFAPTKVIVRLSFVAAPLRSENVTFPPLSPTEDSTCASTTSLPVPPAYVMTKFTELIVTVAPSASPAKVPVIASDPSFWMIVISCPALDVIVPEVESVAPPRATVPVTFSWSYRVPTVAPFTSAVKVEPLVKVTLPEFKIAGLFPGARKPPLATLTVPFTVPEPPSVAVLLTDTALAEFVEPFTNNVPAATVVAPV